MVERIGEPSGLEYLPRMLTHLSASGRERALGLFVEHAPSIPRLADALTAVPPGLESRTLDSLLEHARSLDLSQGKAKVLTLLVSRVSTVERARTADEARAAIDRSAHSGTRVELLLEIDDVAGAERELEGARSTLRPDELATLVATLAPHLPEARRDHWVRVALEAGENGDCVLERLAPVLTLEQARSYLANQIVPQDPRDRSRLIAAKNLDLPYVYAKYKEPTAAGLARRMDALGEAGDAFGLLEVARNDGVTAMALLELAPHLPRDQVLLTEQRVRSATLEYPLAAEGMGWVGVDRSYFTGRLAPSLARVGEVDLALTYARGTDADRRVASYLGIAQTTAGELRTEALIDALTTVLNLPDWSRREQIDGVAAAIAGDDTAAAAAWRSAVNWARTQTRYEAIETMASLAPVAAAIGGAALVDSVFDAMERVLRWWP
jgi:hypothetical protein